MDWNRLCFYYTTWRNVGRICRSSQDYVRQLPSLEGQLPGRYEQGIIYASCNDLYFEKYTRDLLKSAALRSPHQHFHLHLYDPQDATLALLEQMKKHQSLSFTWEYLDYDRYNISMRGGVYFVTARFVRLWQILSASKSTLLSIDADAVVVNSLDRALSGWSGCDVALFLRKRRDPLRKVLGAALIALPSAKGSEFMYKLANVCSYYVIEGGWEAIDQLLLYHVWKWCTRNISGFRYCTLDRKYSDWDYSSDSYVWHAKGKRKLDKQKLRSIMT